MNAEFEKRWRAALAKGLDAPPMPAELKEGLIALGRRRRRRARLERLRELLPPWAFGAGAAFAAAALLLALLPRAAEPPARAADPAALAELWIEDEGGTDEG